MGNNTIPDPLDGIWKQFIQQLIDHGVKPDRTRWYVIRAERYLRSSPHDALALHRAEDVHAYLDTVGRSGRLEDWQFQQLVDSLEILFADTAKAPWASTFNWDNWHVAGQRLRTRQTEINRKPPTDGLRGLQKARKPQESGKEVEPDPEIMRKLIAEIRRRAYSIRTEQAYSQWISRFLRFNNEQDPSRLGATHVIKFLEHLAVDRHVSSNTQNQALNALVFLFNQVLDAPLGGLDNLVRAKRPQRLPVVLTRKEVRALLTLMDGIYLLMARLMYGTGMRLMECVRLRVKDVDFDYSQITVRNAKGSKDRVVPLPETLTEALRDQISLTKTLHQKDLMSGFGAVHLPDALAKKFPNAPREWIWQYVFPSERLSVDPRTGRTRRHHLHENSLQKAIKKAARTAKVSKKVSSHTFRHSFATHLIESGYDIRTVQELLGHADVSTTMIYTHVLNRGGKGVKSPLDVLG